MEYRIQDPREIAALKARQRAELAFQDPVEVQRRVSLGLDETARVLEGFIIGLAPGITKAEDELG